MKVRIEEMTLDDLFNEMYKFFNDGLEEEESKMSCTENDKKIKYDYTNNKNCDCKQEQSDLVKRLRKEIEIRNKKIETLEAQNKAIIENGNKVSKEGHKIADESAALNRIISDKIMADGYKIVNDIKVWIEFVRKCDRLGAPAFLTMMDMLNKTVSVANDAKR